TADRGTGEGQAEPGRHFDVDTIVEDGGDGSVDTTRGDDVVTDGDGRDHCLMLANTLLLRTDQEEVEGDQERNREDEQHRNRASTDDGAEGSLDAGRSSLGVQPHTSRISRRRASKRSSAIAVRKSAIS